MKLAKNSPSNVEGVPEGRGSIMHLLTSDKVGFAIQIINELINKL